MAMIDFPEALPLPSISTDVSDILYTEFERFWVLNLEPWLYYTYHPQCPCTCIYQLTRERSSKVIHLEIILGDEKLFRRPLKLVKCMPQQPLEKRETRCFMRLPVNSDLFGNGDVDGICDSLPSIFFLFVLVHWHVDNFATQVCILLVHGRQHPCRLFSAANQVLLSLRQ